MKILEIQKDLATLLPNLFCPGWPILFFGGYLGPPFCPIIDVVAGVCCTTCSCGDSVTLLIDRIQVKTAYSNIQFVFILS